MPFSPMKALNTFEGMMSLFVKILPFVRVYIDEVVIFLGALEYHVIYIKKG